VISPRAVIETTDWKSLYHAYEHAQDTPHRLLGLLSGDPQVCGEALAFLDAAILHQGTIYPVTAPVAAFVAGILSDERTAIHCESALPWDKRIRPLRAGLLEWLGSVAESTTWSEEDVFDDDLDDDDLRGDEDLHGDDGDDGWRADSEAATRACAALLPDLYEAIKPYLDDPDRDVQQAAMGALGRMMAAPELVEFRGEQVERLLRTAAHETPRERAIIALTLGNWGMVPGSLLADSDPMVRACAAIAPALDADPAALAEVQLALRDPRTADAWFPEWIPQLDGRFRFALVRALLRRTTVFEQIVDSALAIAAMTNAYTVEADWGPLLRRAFPDGYAGQPLSPAQRAFLTAIADNEECWNSVANPLLLLNMLGLPDHRDRLRSLP
jgi:hypothetical protein